MKKTAFLLILLMLCIPTALAETNLTIGEVRDALPATWQATYQTRWRDVTVDVTPTVPDVETAPVLMVRPAFWQPEMPEDAPWTVSERIAYSMFGLRAGMDGQTTYSEKTEPVSTFFYAPLDYDTAYAPANDLTVNDALSLLDRILTTLGHDHFGVDTEHLPFVRTQAQIGKKSGKPAAPGEMCLTLHTTLRDIPIWHHVVWSIDSRHDREQYYYPHVSFRVWSESKYDFAAATVRETAEVAADVPLCSFDLVRAAIEAEINAGHIRAVYAVDLGYALYNLPGAPLHEPGSDYWDDAEFYCAPTWQVVCLYTNQPKKELKDAVYENRRLPCITRPSTSTRRRAKWSIPRMAAAAAEIIRASSAGRTFSLNSCWRWRSSAPPQRSAKADRALTASRKSSFPERSGTA